MRKARQETRATTIVIYSIVIFILIFIHDWLPEKNRRYYFPILYTSAEYLSFAVIFWLSIQRNRFQNVIVLLSVAFIAFQIVYSLTTKFRRLDSVPIGVETILIFIYCFYFLYQEFNREDNQLIIKNAVFWVMIGIVFYLAGSFFFNILVNDIPKEQQDKYWIYTYLFDIIKNVFFVVSIVLFTKQHPKKLIKTTIPYLDIDHVIKHN